MKRAMRCARLALTSLGLVAVLTSLATAEPIAYTESFTAGTVSLDGQSFTKETVTLSGVGDTSKITSGTNGLANDVTLSVTVGSMVLAAIAAAVGGGLSLVRSRRRGAV